MNRRPDPRMPDDEIAGIVKVDRRSGLGAQGNGIIRSPIELLFVDDYRLLSRAVPLRCPACPAVCPAFPVLRKETAGARLRPLHRVGKLADSRVGFTIREQRSGLFRDFPFPTLRFDALSFSNRDWRLKSMRR
jgi:hypothetical protein